MKNCQPVGQASVPAAPQAGKDTRSTESKTALITGASGGIGADLAKIFAQEGYNLVLVARGKEAMQQLANELQAKHGTSSKILVKDLAVPSAPDEIYAELQRENIQIDVLVNNAGIGTHGFLHETPLESTLQMVQINMVALTHLTKLFVDGMVERKSGKILNVASTAAFQPGPLMAVYYASKAYVLWFSEALAEELNGTGVTVTALCPGPTRTGFQSRARMGEVSLATGKTLRMMSSETVAQAGYDGLMRGKTIVIPGLMNKTLAFSVRLSPRKLTAKIARALQEDR